MLFLSTGCGEFHTSQSLTLSSFSDTDKSLPPPLEPPLSKLDFCSQLDLEEISWPQELSSYETDIFALAMNITGSFEGREEWGNLTNNFDGQGISLGLFQQNLGQGSLQELLILTYSQFPKLFDNHLSLEQKESLINMLAIWQGSPLTLTRQTQAQLKMSFKTGDYSLLDHIMTFQKASNGKNQTSVDWALANVFESDKKTFKPLWKSALKNLATDPRYISMQILAANNIHQKAQKLANEYSVSELRSYLFFFDIVVQNGGIPNSIRNLYLASLEKEAKPLSEVEKMKILLEHRLTLTRPQYVNDVRSRKTAILDGVGVVHQTNRDFPKEFCVSNWSQDLE